MEDSVSDRFFVLKDFSENLLLQGTRCSRFPFWQVCGAFYPCRHLMFWALQCLQKECNHNPCNWSNIALIVRFEILREEEHDLLETAKAYVLCSGDVIKTAELLFCHKNTVRYRLAKIQEVIDPANKDKDFYESLSIAIRIYILTQFKK